MKKIYSITIAILIFASLQGVYAEDSQPALYLFDKDGAVLDNLNQDGFFEEWAKVFYGQLPPRDGSGASILLSAGQPAGSWASFTLEMDLPEQQTMTATWDYADEDHFDDMAEDSIGDIMQLTNAARVNGLHQAISDRAITTNIRDLECVYDDNGMVQEYSFIYKEVPTPGHRFWRTVGEIFFFSMCGEAWYWINKDANMEDWEYKLNGEGAKAKFIDGWSLDTNNFRTNTIYHMYAGALYYQTARSNGYGFFASTAFSFMGSLFWEYLGEWREQVSTNDMIFTPFAGSLMGEGFTQVALFAQEEIESPFVRYPIILVLDPMRIVNNYLDSLIDGDFRVRIQFTSPAQMAADRYINRDGNAGQ